MFEIKWANQALWKGKARINEEFTSNLKPEQVDKTMLLAWEEHCVECAIPECYSNCPLYIRRSDGKCSRFVYGIYPNSNFQGHFKFGADITFRRWAKLEAAVEITSVAVGNLEHSIQARYFQLPPRIQVYVAKLYEWVLGQKADYDEFVIECYSPHQEKFELFLEYFIYVRKGVRNTLFRRSFSIGPGKNYYTIPCSEFKIQEKTGHILLYPDTDNFEKRLIFTWLDFVKYSSINSLPQRLTHPAAKIKCVAWDLDNTLWKGTLIESQNPGDLEVRTEAIALIKELDALGILQTVVSKNNNDDALAKLRAEGLEDYFLYPAINWGQKSENLKVIAKMLNIGLDTFALIDDSPFERDEVAKSLPQVRVYPETDLLSLLARPEFDVPATLASKTRRHSYLAQMTRESVQATFTGSYDEFLRSCKMVVRIFSPANEDHILRCWELVQRSNQLNLSGRRYTKEEFSDLIVNSDSWCLALECRDKYGDYGIVGFSYIRNVKSQPLMSDYVLSCRVAQKKVEHAFIGWVRCRLLSGGHRILLVDFVATEKNYPLRQVFAEIPFSTIKTEGAYMRLQLDLTQEIESVDVVSAYTEESDKICSLTYLESNHSR